jgi:hypothetical protein
VGVQQFEVFELALGLAEAVADDHEPAVGAGHPLQATGDLGEVGVGDVVHDHADRAAVRARQHLGVRVRHVLQFGDRREHAFAQGVGDRFAAAVDDPGCGRGGDAGSARDVRQGGHAPQDTGAGLVRRTTRL